MAYVSTLRMLYFQDVNVLSSTFVPALFLKTTLEKSLIKGIRGGNITLPCPVPNSSSDQLPTISWQKSTRSSSTVSFATSFNGVSQINETLRSRVRLQGGNLTISSLLLADAGTYTCTFFAEQYSKKLNPVILIIIAAPIVRANKISSPTVGVDNKYSAAVCVAGAGKPAAKVQWTNKLGIIQESRNQNTMAEDGSITVRSELRVSIKTSNFSNFFTNEEKIQDFICKVDYEGLIGLQQATKTIEIHLLYPPEASITILGNRLSCSADGNPFPAIKWVLPNSDVIHNTSSIFLKQDASGNGRYSCLAASDLKPDAIAAIEVQKANDLPILFRTFERLNTSLPITASGYKILCSADIESETPENQFEFEWTKNGLPIMDNRYKVTTRKEKTSPSRFRLESTFSFQTLDRYQDDAVFQCRMMNVSTLTGFVTAIQRSVAISVDYPPESIEIIAQPKELIVVEGQTLILKCSAKSRPQSRYQWYFREGNIVNSSLLKIRNMQRHQAGSYRCVAFNYVPGSVSSNIYISVHYPPAGVEIIEKGGGALLCRTKTGSVPEPQYSWIYPNSTRILGNNSIISLVAPPISGKFVYVCIASNTIGSANTTFLQFPPKPQKIGILSLTEFTVVVVIIIFVCVALLGLVAWKLRRRRSISRTSHKKTAGESFRQYWQFVDPSRNTTSVCEANTLSSFSLKDRTTIQDRLHLKQKASTDTFEVTEAHMSPSPSLRSEQQLKTFTGPKPSFTESNFNQDDACNRNDKTLSPKLMSNNSVSPPDSTKSSGLRKRNVSQEMERQTRVQDMAKYRYFQPNAPLTIGHDYRIPMRVPGYPCPLRVFTPGYGQMLQSDSWSPNHPNHHANTFYAYPSSTFDSSNIPNIPVDGYSKGEEDYFVSNPTGGYVLSKFVVPRPRSVSLSASSLSRESSTFNTDDCKTKKKILLHSETCKNQNSPSRTLSPFDSGNDSTRSLQACASSKKQQSLTLV